MVRGTFSPARAWRPAVGARLARTLGIAMRGRWCTSRVSACRRGLNSHEAAEPRGIARPQVHRRAEKRSAETSEWRRNPAAANGNEMEPPCHIGPAHCVGSSQVQPVFRAAAGDVAVAADGGGGLNAPHTWVSSAEREATVARHAEPQGLLYRQRASSTPALPNPSLKGSTNGMPPGPGWRYAVHFRHPGPGVMPLAPP